MRNHNVVTAIYLAKRQFPYLYKATVSSVIKAY